jgi:hypothetical protein
MIGAINSAAFPMPTPSSACRGGDQTSCRRDGQSVVGTEEQATKSTSAKGKDKDLSTQESQETKALEARDREVRAHEASHKAAAGALAQGSASFTYETGPDGQRYAVGGEVSIDTSPVANDPEATLRKAETIRAAALAPAEPSAQDHAVAAQAAQMAMEARAEIAQRRSNDPENEDQGKNTPANPGISAYAQTPQSAAENAGPILNLFA